VSVFGWSLPPGCTTLPGENEPDERVLYRCSACGGFLREKPDRTEDKEGWAHCLGWTGTEEWPQQCAACDSDKIHGPHKFLIAQWKEFFRICGRCGHENKDSDY
jgi:hypothetical protein